jgi:hypothetical protein
MICVAEEISLLTKQENQLHNSLDNLRGQRSKVKEHRQLEKDLAVVLGKRQNLQAWSVFEIGMPVHRIDLNRLGIVKELKITPGGMGELGWCVTNSQNSRICYRLMVRRWQKLLL